MKPILFNTQMVQAIQDGRKTCARRAVKPQPKGQIYPMPQGSCYPGCWGCAGTDAVARAPYQPGDVLWVREAWCKYNSYFHYKESEMTNDSAWLEDKNIKWRPSIHMPKEATRIFLRVKGVRMELLQDIDDDGAKAEGANYQDGKNVGWEEKMRRSAIDRFAEIWDNTLKPADRALYGWAANPWVWVIEFERISKDEALGGGGAK